MREGVRREKNGRKIERMEGGEGGSAEAEGWRERWDRGEGDGRRRGRKEGKNGWTEGGGQGENVEEYHLLSLHPL